MVRPRSAGKSTSPLSVLGSDTDATRAPTRCRVAPSSIGGGIVDQSGASTALFIAAPIKSERPYGFCKARAPRRAKSASGT
jgi:hypothetical protein